LTKLPFLPESNKLNILGKLYSRLRFITAKSEEKGEASSGFWPSGTRRQVEQICKKAEGKLFEIGCGEGLFILTLATANPQLEIVGVDKNIDRLLSAREKCESKKLKNVKFIYTNAINLSIKDKCFDYAVCINTLYNFKSIEIVGQVLEQMARVCKKKGRVIFDFRNSLNPLVRLKYKLAPYYDLTVKKSKLPLNTYHPKDIENILRKLNFRIINRIYIGFPVKILAPVIIIEAEKC